MTRRLPFAFAVVGLVGAGLVSVPFIANAQQDDAAPAQQNQSGWHRFMPTPEDRAAFLDARIAALHAGLELTADQEKLWPPVAQALRDFGKLTEEQRQKFHDEKDKLDPVARLEMRSDNMVARGQALKKVAEAAKPLYAGLNDAQKNRLPILVRAIFRPFHHHHFAMMERMREMMHDHMMGHMGDHMMGNQPNGGDGPEDHD